MQMTKTRKEIHDDGFLAYCEGKYIYENPYHKLDDSISWAWWRLGYQQAYDQDK